MPVGGSEAALDIARRQFGEGLEEPGPDRARRAFLRDVLIGNSRQPRIAARPLRHLAIGPAERASLAASVTTSLAGVSRHSDSPAIKALILNAGAASSSRGSKETRLCVLRAADRSCRGYGHDPETGRAAALRPRRS